MSSHSTALAPLGVDQAALLSAIISHPDEDTPRLAYADLLQEYGDHARAEFIRLQVELDSNGGGLPDREELEARAARLLERHRPEWEAGVRVEGVTEVTFRRGFVDGVTATAGAFVRAGAGWWRTHPVRHVRLEQVGGELTRVAAAAHLDSVRSLWLVDDFEEPDLRAWAEAPRPGGAGRYPWLEALSVGGWTKTDDFFWGGAAVLAACDMPRLRELHLIDWREGDQGAAAVAAAPWFEGLELLNIWTSRVGDRGLAALLRPPRRTKLSDLTVGWSRVSARGLHAVADLPAEPPLRRLSLAGNRRGMGTRPSGPDWSIDPGRLGAVLAKHPALRIDLTTCPIPPAIRTVVEEQFGDRVRVGST